MGYEPMPSHDGTEVLWEPVNGGLIKLIFTSEGDYLGFHMEIK